MALPHARDLDRASIYNRDLAHTPGYLDPGQLGAPGRGLPDWQAHALGAMAAHLDEQGWEVFHDQAVKVTGAAPPGGILSAGTEIAGALRARRYGYQAAILVRVDDCGEIYARLAEDGDVTGPALRALTDDDYDLNGATVNCRKSPPSCRRCPGRDRRGRRGWGRRSGSGGLRGSAAPGGGASRLACGCRAASG